MQQVNDNYPNFNKEIEVFTDRDSGYRMRAEFGIYHETTAQGYSVQHTMFNKDGTRNFINNQHPIANQLINELMGVMVTFLQNHFAFVHKLFQIEYLTTRQQQAIISLIFHRELRGQEDQEVALELQQYLQSQLPHLTKVNIILRARKKQLVIGDIAIEEKFLVNDTEIRLLQVENSFSQPNAAINEKMLNYVAKHLPSYAPADILELYCGVGNFTMVLAQTPNRVVATEVNKQAVTYVNLNLELNNITNTQVGRVSAEEFVQAINKVRPFKRLQHIDLESYNFKTLFVDPPRSGLDEKSLDTFANYDNIIYVSCNPHTLFANLRYLTNRHGFQLCEIACFDQFPQTEHLEAIAILTKA